MKPLKHTPLFEQFVFNLPYIVLPNNDKKVIKKTSNNTHNFLTRKIVLNELFKCTIFIYYCINFF